LISIYLRDGRSAPDFYLLILNQDGELTPVGRNNRIHLFTDCRAIAKAKRLSDQEIRDVPLDEEGYLDIYAGTAMRLAAYGNVDRRAILIHFINLFEDVLPYVGVKWPSRYREALMPLADRVTFYREFGSVFKQEGVTRELALDGLRWCMGVLLSNSQFIEPE
jgi:hypothetical protein